MLFDLWLDSYLTYICTCALVLLFQLLSLCAVTIMWRKKLHILCGLQEEWVKVASSAAERGRLRSVSVSSTERRRSVRQEWHQRHRSTESVAMNQFSHYQA